MTEADRPLARTKLASSLIFSYENIFFILLLLLSFYLFIFPRPMSNECRSPKASRFPEKHLCLKTNKYMIKLNWYKSILTNWDSPIPNEYKSLWRFEESASKEFGWPFNPENSFQVITSSFYDWLLTIYGLVKVRTPFYQVHYMPFLAWI